MTNGGYKILDLNGEEIVRGEINFQLKTDVISVIKKAESSGKPILLSNVKIINTSGSEPIIDFEVTVPIFINICKIPVSASYVFDLPNGITASISEENTITVD